MKKRGIKVIYTMLGLVALWFTSTAVANAQVTVTSVVVTVSSTKQTAIYCDFGTTCTNGIKVWDLGGGITVAPGKTLVLTQYGSVPGAATEGSFDTSDQVTYTGAVGSCSTVANGSSGSTATPCTVTIVINGTQVYQSAAGDPLDFYNKDDGTDVTSEYNNWLQVANPTGYTLKLGYADNTHSNSVTCATPCFPSPFFLADNFIGLGLGAVGNCPSNCYDGGALLITGVQITTPFTGCTVTQGGWGSKPHGNNPGTFLVANFPAGGVTIGLGFPSASPFSLHFNSAVAVEAFLPQGGPPGALSATALNPTARTSAGVFAGQVLALTLNAQLKGFGSYVLSGTGTSFDTKTVNDVLAAANLAISGGALPTGFTYSSLNDLVDKLNNLFDNCSK